MMVEPTETESKETLDKFAKKFVEVLQEDPDVLHNAPVTTKYAALTKYMLLELPNSIISI